jgi:hypothetical protein
MPAVEEVSGFSEEKFDRNYDGLKKRLSSGKAAL